jgi:hypothetical protein
MKQNKWLIISSFFFDLALPVAANEQQSWEYIPRPNSTSGRFVGVSFREFTALQSSVVDEAVEAPLPQR